ncbi:MAG: hypothetical protein V4857_11205 [Pseudomonadota bacterium]
MTDTAQGAPHEGTQGAPHETAQRVPDEAEVRWFGASARLVGGQPDSRYGWLDTADGPCIVKALAPALAAFADTLLQHERAMLRRLAALGAPAPALVDAGRADWLVTRFAGLSLQRLEQGGVGGPGARFPFAERLSAWIHLLGRLQPVADSGVLPLDLYGANVVLPLTGQTRGQLRLHEAAMIDHAHTVQAGMNMRRPVWLDHNMERIAPELRAVLARDQQALVATFHALGAALPGTAADGANAERNRRAWVDYDREQALQTLLDGGALNRDHAIQYAAGTQLAKLMPLAGGHAPALARVLDRMTAHAAPARFATLDDAAAALKAVLGTLAMVGHHHYRPLDPDELASPRSDRGAPMPASNAQSGPAQFGATQAAELHSGTVDLVSPQAGTLQSGTLRLDAMQALQSGATQAAAAASGPIESPYTMPAGRVRRDIPARVLYAAAAAAAALAAVLPLP